MTLEAWRLVARHARPNTSLRSVALWKKREASSSRTSTPSGSSSLSWCPCLSSRVLEGVEAPPPAALLDVAESSVRNRTTRKDAQRHSLPLHIHHSLAPTGSRSSVPVGSYSGGRDGLSALDLLARLLDLLEDLIVRRRGVYDDLLLLKGDVV